MKSDREFIDGIYSKAAAYEKEKVENKNKHTFLEKCSNWLKVHRMQVSFATGIAFCGIILSVGLNHPRTDKINENLRNTPNAINHDLENLPDTINHDSENIPDSMTKNQRGVQDMESPASYDFAMEENGMAVAEPRTTIYGDITAIYETDLSKFAEIKVHDSNDSLIIDSTITFLLPKEQSNIVDIGEEVIVKLIKESGMDYYTLDDFKEDLFRLEEENQEKVYISINGGIMKEDEVKE